MKKRMMSWQLLTSYFAILIIIAMIAASIFYYINLKRIYDEGKINLSKICVSSGQEVDRAIKFADDVSVEMMKHPKFMSSFTKDSFFQHNSIIYQIYAKNYPRQNAIYKIVMFNPNGEVVSFGKNDLNADEIIKLSKSKTWEECTKLKSHAKMFVGAHLDDWVKEDKKEVVSLIRTIYKGNEVVGFFEVQILTSNIAQICKNEWNGTELPLVITNSNGDVFYSNFLKEDFDSFFETVKNRQAWYPVDILETKDAFISIAGFNYADLKIAFVLPKRALIEQVGVIRNSIILFVTTVLAIVILFSFLISKYITKPYNELIDQIENIHLNNLNKSLTYKNESREIAVLGNSFEMMRVRLNESLIKENAIKDMQTKVLFEALQSRIGPHFLYNTLGSIANMCQTGENEAAADACYSLSDILRYSADYKNIIVDFSEEVDNVNNYLLLMKGRYRQRLEYKVCLDMGETILKVPKLTLQPLAENAIKYSLLNNEVVHVALSLYKSQDSIIIKIIDNGTGFANEDIFNINKTIEAFLKSPSLDFIEENVSFGRMGLTGTLLRLYLHFGNKFSFSLKNLEKGGAEIVIGLNLE